jgi:hypothetical protein
MLCYLYKLVSRGLSLLDSVLVFVKFYCEFSFQKQFKTLYIKDIISAESLISIKKPLVVVILVKS